MVKEYIKFGVLNESDQEYFLRETWCDKCDKADLGLKDPVMYLESGQTYISGSCTVCGEQQTSQVITKSVDG